MQRGRSTTDAHVQRSRLLWWCIYSSVLVGYRSFVNGEGDSFVSTNYFLGSCLTQEWVQSMEAQLGVNASTRDPTNRRLVFPFLQKAVPQDQLRYRIDDERTSNPFVFTDGHLEEETTLYPANVKLDANGTMVDTGSINGSLILQFAGWSSHTLTSTVFSILAGEVLGYPIAQLWPTHYEGSVERMSSVGLGRLSPVHIDVELWPVGLEEWIADYSNETYLVGSTGYIGRSGVYTTREFVQNGLNNSRYKPPFSADFYKDYQYNEELIDAVPVSLLWNNTEFFPPPSSSITCDDDVMGCRHYCSKSYACTLREQHGKECMVLIRDYYADDAGYIEAMFDNHDIPAYFCFLGVETWSHYVVHMQQRGLPVVFYHWVPDEFHYRYPRLFERVFFPEQDLDHPSFSTGSFGENGYGMPTQNPVTVDFPPEYLVKYASGLILAHAPVATLLDRFFMSQSNLDKLMFEYVRILPPESPFRPDKFFDAACTWVQQHYDVWKDWMDPLPLCTQDDVEVRCRNETYVMMDGETHVQWQHVEFQWKQAHPKDPRLSYTCDGGFSLPTPRMSHFACATLIQLPVSWFLSQHLCDSTYYHATIGECHSSATQVARMVRYEWYLPPELALDPTLSSECIGKLPPDDSLSCDYLPLNSKLYLLMAFLAGSVALVFLVGMVIVFRLRYTPIIQHAQHVLLQIILCGGLLVCLNTFSAGGKPTRLVCGFRVVWVQLGFTCTCGSMLVRSIGAYQLSFCEPKRRKMEVVEIRKAAMRWLRWLFLVDLLVLTSLLTLAPPEEVVVTRDYISVKNVNDLQCMSRAPITWNLLLGWKLVLAIGTLVLSFGNNRVNLDYKESFWICVVCTSLGGGMLLLVLLSSLPFSVVQWTLLVTLITLFGALLAVGCLIIPRLWRRHDTKIHLAGPRYAPMRRPTTNGWFRKTRPVLSIAVAPYPLATRSKGL